MKARELDQDKLFMAYEECRADNTAHFRKIMELQKENAKLKADLAFAVRKMNEALDEVQDQQYHNADLTLSDAIDELDLDKMNETKGDS